MIIALTDFREIRVSVRRVPYTFQDRDAPDFPAVGIELNHEVRYDRRAGVEAGNHMNLPAQDEDSAIIAKIHVVVASSGEAPDKPGIPIKSHKAQPFVYGQETSVVEQTSLPPAHPPHTAFGHVRIRPEPLVGNGPLQRWTTVPSIVTSNASGACPATMRL